MDENVKIGQLEFPLEYVLKVIFADGADESGHLMRLESLLDALSIPRKKSSIRQSGKGRYISISVPVRVATRSEFDELYKRLNSLPSVKTAI